MTQDCSHSPSTAAVSKRLPKGIHVTETDDKSASGIEGTPWGYLFIHNKTAEVFEHEMNIYNQRHPDSPIPCFIHRSYRYKPKTEKGGVKKQYKPTISGLIFLQGYTQDLKEFLKEVYPALHLVNDRSTRLPASIPDKVMQPFMRLVQEDPDRITFLRDPFEKFAKDHVLLRIVSGIFAGCEGYIIRIDRDRQLVFNFGGYAVAIRGIHKEDFVVVEQ